MTTDYPYSKDPIIRDIEAFRDQLIALCIKNAKGLDGPEVVRALVSITDDLYHGTIDEAYDNTEFKHPESMGSLWDCIWMSSFARKLLKVKNKKHENTKISKRSLKIS